MRTNFAGLLKGERERIGLTQKELAKLIKVDNTYISKIERGVLPPPAREKVLKIADVLGIHDKVQRYHFLLAAACASIEDLEGLDKTVVGEHMTSIPPRHVGLVLAHPPMAQKNTMGDRIERLVAMADLSEAEKEVVEKHLEAVTKVILALLNSFHQLHSERDDKA